MPRPTFRKLYSRTHAAVIFTINRLESEVRVLYGPGMVCTAMCDYSDNR